MRIGAGSLCPSTAFDCDPCAGAISFRQLVQWRRMWYENDNPTNQPDTDHASLRRVVLLGSFFREIGRAGPAAVSGCARHWPAADAIPG